MNYVAQTSAIEPDAQLVQRIAANGDASAMAELDARHSKTLYAIAYSVLFDPDAAEQAVAATFREVSRSARWFVASGRSAQRWLVEMIRRIAIPGPMLVPAPAPAPRWAQVRNDSRCSLRRGAWYNVLKFTRDSVVLDVHHEPRSVSSQLVRIAPEKPMRWSVVRRPDDSVTMPPSWGVRYAVCPHCQSRAELMSMSDQMWCESCHGVFPIDWAER